MLCSFLLKMASCNVGNIKPSYVTNPVLYYPSATSVTYMVLLISRISYFSFLVYNIHSFSTSTLNLYKVQFKST